VTSEVKIARDRDNPRILLWAPIDKYTHTVIQLLITNNKHNLEGVLHAINVQ
jgi:hypothetical protein